MPGAVREPGHPLAHGYEGVAEPKAKRGLVYHSAEGGLFSMRRIIQAPGEPSWTFSNPKKGRLIQHYERGTNIWANGSLAANVSFDACESEGMAGEPLTESQVQNLIDLAKWYKKEEGWQDFKRQVQAWEHKEMTRFGAPYTECPSGRICWDIIIPAVEDAMVSQADFDAFVAQQKAIHDYQNVVMKATWARIDYLAKIATDQEKRLKALEP
jgi:hypothetical protein